MLRVDFTNALLSPLLSPATISPPRSNGPAVDHQESQAPGAGDAAPARVRPAAPPRPWPRLPALRDPMRPQTCRPAQGAGQCGQDHHHEAAQRRGHWRHQPHLRLQHQDTGLPSVRAPAMRRALAGHPRPPTSRAAVSTHGVVCLPQTRRLNLFRRSRTPTPARWQLCPGPGPPPAPYSGTL